MSGGGDYTDEMGHLTGLSEKDLERLLSGMAPADGALDGLAALVRDAHSAYKVVPGRAVQDRHVLSIVQQARLAIDNGDPVARPVRKAHGPAWQAAGLPKWRRRRTVLTSLFASLGMKLTLGAAVAATAATGGLAATGNLPDAAQTAVANAVEKIGITIPNPGDASAGHRQDAGTPEDAVETEDSGKSVNEDVKTVLENESLEGRDKGEAVSDAATTNRQDGGTTGNLPSGNPTELGPDANPTEFGPDANPTEFGPDANPAGDTTELGPDANPTELGPGTAPVQIPAGRP